MKLQITINCAYSAFGDYPELECISILEDCITSLRSRGVEDMRLQVRLQDVNGNTVGKMEQIDTTQEQESNARFLVAVTDLLDALKTLARQEDWQGDDVDPDSPVGKAWTAIDNYSIIDKERQLLKNP